MESRRYFAITSSQELPREQQRVLRNQGGIQIVDGSLPPVPFSLTFVGERGATQTAKLFIAKYEDTAARYYVGRPLWNGGVPSAEALRPGDLRNHDEHSVADGSQSPLLGCGPDATGGPDAAF